MELRPANDERLELIADRVILHENFVGFEHVLNVGDAWGRHALRASPIRAFQIPPREAIPPVPVRGLADFFLGCRIVAVATPPTFPTSFRRV